MSDPYNPLEKKYRLMARSLEVIAQYGFPIHIITKSNMVMRDIDILCEISRIYAAVSFTITTTDDVLAKKLEPGAPSPTERLKAMGVLSAAGIYTGVTMMPILPYIEDNEENIRSIVEKTAHYGGKYIIPAMGMTMRDRQRAYYYNKLDQLFPGLKEKYEKSFGDRYSCSARKANLLGQAFVESCRQYGIATRMNFYNTGPGYEQLTLI
jgi:DNA repair photolyase